MKRVRCPKCDNFITFDEKKYTEGQSLVFQCPDCGKQFGIRIGVSKLRNTQKEDIPEENAEGNECGYITVIENVFHYKQVIPLHMGVNVIGRYMKNSGVNCAIETNDPSIDINHCSITVSRDKSRPTASSQILHLYNTRCAYHQRSGCILFPTLSSDIQG